LIGGYIYRTKTVKAAAIASNVGFLIYAALMASVTSSTPESHFWLYYILWIWLRMRCHHALHHRPTFHSAGAYRCNIWSYGLHQKYWWISRCGYLQCTIQPRALTEFIPKGCQ